MLNNVLKFDPVIYVSLGAILGAVLLKLFQLLIDQYRSRSQEYRTAYAKFAETFTPYLQDLEMGESTLNVLIVGEFPKHDLARRDFIRHLGRRSKRKFDYKWLEYEQKYYEVKQLGVIGMAVALAPPGYDLVKNRPMPDDMIKWELNRRQALHNIITELLHITKP